VQQVTTTPLSTGIDLAVFAAVRPGTALTVEQKREFIRGAMVAGGQDWARDTLRLPVDIVPLDYWSAGMVEKAFTAIRTRGRRALTDARAARLGSLPTVRSEFGSELDPRHSHDVGPASAHVEASVVVS